MGGRVKTLHPKLYAGLLALRDDPAHMAAAERARGRVRRPRVREPLPVRGHGGPPRRDRARGDREHRHRRPDDDPRGGEELRASPPSWSSPRATTRCCRSCATRDGQLSLPHARERWPPRRSPTRRATTPRSRAGSPRSRATSRELMMSRLREGHRPLVRREPAPARRLLLAGRRAHARALDGAPARRQGAVVQQRARPQLGPAAGAGVRGPRVRDHQAQQPVRGGGRRLGARGLPARLRVRPAVGLRRRHLLQPRRSTPSSPRRSPSQFVEVVHRARASPTRRSSVLRQQAEPAHPRGRRAPPRQHRRARPQARDGRPARAGPRHRPRGPHGDGGRHRAQAVRAEWGEMLFAWKVCKHVRSNAIVLVAATSRRSASAPAR